MTTVIYSNGFLMADKRMTSTKRSMASHLIDQDVSKSMLDHSVKICVEPFVRKLFHKGKRVMAFGHAGSVKSYEDVELFLKKSSCTLLTDVAALSPFCAGPREASILAVLEDGGFCTISLDGSYTLTEGRSDVMSIGLLGSGQKYYDPLMRELLKNGTVTLEEVFLYMVSRDPGSSIDYSAYSLSEDKLFTVIGPKHADYGPKTKKVHKELEVLFDKRKTKHYGA